MQKDNINKFHVLFAVFGVILLLITVAGSAYAYYMASKSSNPGDITGEALGNANNMEISITKISNASGKLIPISGTAITLSKAAKGWNNTINDVGTEWNPDYACKDKFGYTVCQIYQINVTNNNSTDDVYRVTIELTKTNTPNIKAVRVNSDKITISSVAGVDTTPYELASNLEVGEGEVSSPIYAMVYVKNINEVQNDAGVFSGVVTVTNASGEQLQATF